ncbi:hypothetical protein Gotri_026561 [Gossypium trilobum]|uniref:CCHC-type domain-containing protein n=1 Tax=Gossypium trilobum TaxID=34281 RepID=A0A7J9FMP7_9ROSI|nr:hypothetical protein [Gossypium trilobum]
MVEPNGKPSLICSIWTKNSYNHDSFKAQMKSIWKTKEKFEIQLVGQNLFLITFESEDDLETVMEGQPWLFRKHLIIFDRLFKPMERDQIRLVSSPFWIKIGPYLPEFDKKDLLHAIGVTFGGVLRSEISGEFCRLRIKLNVQKPLRRGIFVSTGNGNKCWIPFKYEKLPTFCFGCGRLGHGLQECTEITPAGEIRIREDPPFSLALKVELNLVGKEGLKLNAQSKKLQAQCSYTGDSIENQKVHLNSEQRSGTMKGEANERNTEIRNANILKSGRKASWKRTEPMEVTRQNETESKLQKRKWEEIIQAYYGANETREEATKRMRYGDQNLIQETDINLSIELPN